jgi:hypothetical protein
VPAKAVSQLVQTEAKKSTVVFSQGKPLSATFLEPSDCETAPAWCRPELLAAGTIAKVGNSQRKIDEPEKRVSLLPVGAGERFINE